MWVISSGGFKACHYADCSVSAPLCASRNDIISSSWTHYTAPTPIQCSAPVWPTTDDLINDSSLQLIITLMSNNAVRLHWHFFNEGGASCTISVNYSSSFRTERPSLLFVHPTPLPDCLSHTVYQLGELNAECLYVAQSLHSPAHWLSPWQQAHL